MSLKVNKISKLWLGLLSYTYFILLWGTFVRVSRSGDGCGQSWPKCNGQLFFDFENGAQMIEYIHRVTSGLYGLIAMGIVIYTIRKVSFSRIGWVCISFLIFVLVEALIGRTLVVYSYVVDDQRLMRLFWMGMHFLNTLILALNLILLWQKSKYPDLHISYAIRKIFSSWMTWLFLIVSCLGIFTAFFDTTVIAGGKSADNLPGWIAMIRNIHPFVAVGFVLIMAQQYMGSKSQSLLVALVLNLVVGLGNIFFHEYILLQVLHVFLVHMIWLFLTLFLLDQKTD